MQTDELIARRQQLSYVIKANERWADSYQKDAKSFRQIVSLEVALESKILTTFRELARRTDDLVDWSEYERRLQAKVAAGPFDPLGPEFEEAVGALRVVFYEEVARAIATGAVAAERTYSIPLGFDPLKKSVDLAARKQTASLIKNISDTTRDRVRTSVAKSLDLGEQLKDAKVRMRQAIADPRRAELISRTESVKAWSEGQIQFGKASGAETKTWELSGSPCEICQAIVETFETVPIDDSFGDEGGDGPPAHPNCRCGVRINYPKEAGGKGTGDAADLLEDI